MLIQLYMIDYKWVLDLMNTFLKYKYIINKRKEKKNYICLKDG